MTEPFLLLPVASSLHDKEALRSILSGFELSLMGIGIYSLLALLEWQLLHRWHQASRTAEE